MQFELEIIELMMLLLDINVIGNLKQLCEVGVKVVFDDFGMGYMLLYYLCELLLDIVKIDCFLVDVSVGSVNEYIVCSIVSLSCMLNLLMVVEGVEIEQQFKCLLVFGCDWFQGYFFS